MKKILLIEDNKGITEGLCDTFTEPEYELLTAGNLKEAGALLSEHPGLVLLDVSLPDGNGFDFYSERLEKEKTPVIFLTARDEENDIVKGLELGAEDYITKPFDNQELLVRIEAVLRRFQKSTTPNNSKILRFKDLSLDTEAMEAKIRNTPITLTRYEYLILQLLMSSPSKVFTKNNIFESVWNENFIGDDNAINVHIGNLRKKFAKVNPEEKYIQTVWGLGFKMQG